MLIILLFLSENIYSQIGWLIVDLYSPLQRKQQWKLVYENMVITTRMSYSEVGGLDFFICTQIFVPIPKIYQMIQSPTTTPPYQNYLLPQSVIIIYGREVPKI